MKSGTTDKVTPKRTRGGGRNVRVVLTNSQYGRLCRARLERLSCRVFEFPNLEAVRMTASAAPDQETLFISRLSEIPLRVPSKAHAGGAARHLVFANDVPVEAIPTRLMGLDIRDPHRLHVAREESPDAVERLVYRVAVGLIRRDGHAQIADAWLEDGRMVVLSSTFERMNVPLEKLSRLLGDDHRQIEAFEIDDDGSFIYWPHADVHLGWEHLLRLVDPAAALAARRKQADFNQRYGAAIRAVREETGLIQTGVPGITARHLRRVENGETPATRSTLTALAHAHGLSLEDYLNAVAERLAE